MKKNIMKKALLQIKENNEWLVFIYLFVIILLSFLILKPRIAGDSFDYLNSIQFLQTGIKSIDFAPNRLLTTFGALETLILFSKIFGSVIFSWIFINTLFYFFFNFLFYKIILSIQKDEKVATIATLFLAGNYALIVFGLNFLMDMGGWFFYMLSLYFSLQYVNTSLRKFILLASLSVGVGLLFKEYAVLGVIPIACILVYENFYKNNLFYSLKKIFIKSLVPAVLAIVPVLVLYIFIYYKFDYTYIDWLATNDERYVNFNKMAEYIKSFGSLLNILGILCVGGFYSLYKNWSQRDEKGKVFIVSVLLSVSSLFLWPGITQRVLFVSVPAIVLVSSFLFKRYIKYSNLFYIVFVVYFLFSLFMDSFILNFINLPF